MMEHYDYESLSRLARELGRPVRELLALSHKHDPFYAGMPSRKRWAEWFAVHYHYQAWKSRNVLASHSEEEE